MSAYPNAPEIRGALFSDDPIFNDYEGVRNINVPDLSPGFFTAEGPAFAPNDLGFLEGVVELTRKTSLTTPWWAGSGSEWAFNGLDADLPTELQDLEGDDYWDNLPEDERQVFEDWGFESRAFSGLTPEEAEREYKKAREFVRVQGRLNEHLGPANLAYAFASHATAFAGYIITDPINWATFGAGAALRVGGKAAVKQSLKQTGTQAVIGTVKREQLGALGRAGARVSTTGESLQRGTLILETLGLAGKRGAARASIAGTNAGISAGFDYAIQRKEHETFYRWGLIDEEFELGLGRTLTSSFVAAVLGWTLSGGSLKPLTKKNIVESRFGRDSYAISQIRSEILRNPARATEVADAAKMGKHDLIAHLSRIMFTEEEQLRLPWLTKADFWDEQAKLGGAIGRKVDEDTVLQMLENVPTIDELDRALLKKGDVPLDVAKKNETKANHRLQETIEEYEELTEQFERMRRRGSYLEEASELKARIEAVRKKGVRHSRELKEAQEAVKNAKERPAEIEQTAFSAAVETNQLLDKLRTQKARGSALTKQEARRLAVLLHRFERRTYNRLLKDAGLDPRKTDPVTDGEFVNHLSALETLYLNDKIQARVKQIQGRVIDSGNPKASGTAEFVEKFKTYVETTSRLSPHRRTKQEQIHLLDALFNPEFASNFKFLTTGNMEQLREALLDAQYAVVGNPVGWLADIGTRGAHLRRVAQAMQDPNLDAGSRQSLGYVSYIFSLMGDGRQTESAINPFIRSVTTFQRSKLRAEREARKAIRELTDAAGIKNGTDTNTEEYRKLFLDGFRWAGGIGRESVKDPRVAAIGAAWRRYFDSVSEVGELNGHIVNKIDDYLPIFIQGDKTAIANYTPKYHKFLVSEYLDPDRGLHHGTAQRLGWIKYEGERFSLTERGEAAGLSKKIRFGELSKSQRKVYQAALEDKYGQLAKEADVAITRKLTGETPYRPGEFDNAIVKPDPARDIQLYGIDSNRQRKIHQRFWLMDDEALESGLVISHPGRLALMYAAGEGYRVHRQSSVNDIFGFREVNFDGMIAHMEHHVNLHMPDGEYKSAALSAIKQIAAIDHNYANGRAYIPDSAFKKAAYFIRQVASASVNAKVPFLTFAVEGTVQRGRQLVHGDIGGFFTGIARTFGFQKDVSAFGHLANGIQYGNQLRYVPNSKEEALAFVPLSRKDRRWTTIHNLRGTQDPNPGSFWGKRLPRFLNEGTREYGLEKHLSDVNRLMVIDIENQLMHKNLFKLPALVAELKALGRDPTAKEFRGLVRQVGMNSEDFARRALQTGLGEADSLDVISRLARENPNGIKDMDALHAAMTKADGIDPQRITTNRIEDMYDLELSKWLPHGNPYAQPSDESVVGDLWHAFMGYSHNFYANLMRSIGQRTGGKAVAYFLTIAMAEYTAWLIRALSLGQVTPEEVEERWRTDPGGAFGDMIMRSSFAGPVLPQVAGVAVDRFIPDGGQRDRSFSNAIPGQAAYSIMARKVRQLEGLGEDEFNLRDGISAIPGLGELPIIDLIYNVLVEQDN